MENIGIWVAPLSLLSGIGLLIMSTTARYMANKTEVFALVDRKADPRIIKLEVRKSLLFKNALISLYSAFGTLTTGSLVVSLLDYDRPIGITCTISFSIVGLSLVAFASYQLILESILEYNVIKEKTNE